MLGALCTMQDEVIQRFEDRCTEANAEIQQLKAELQDATKGLETAEGRLANTLESRNKLRKQLEAQHSAMASLQAEVEVWKVCSFVTNCIHVAVGTMLCPAYTMYLYGHGHHSLEVVMCL